MSHRLRSAWFGSPPLTNQGPINRTHWLIQKTRDSPGDNHTSAIAMFAGEEEALMADPNGLSDYELERIERIRRNREIMKRLGLGDHDIVSAARQRCGAEEGKENASGPIENKKRKAPAAKKKHEIPAEERATRRSRRIATKDAEHAGLGDDHEETETYIVGRGEYAVEVDGAHEAEAEAYRLRNAGIQERVSVVGTASYQHTLMRVRTMSEPALGNRIKAIERAKGKHAVVKMKLFARVLFLEGYEELSTLATESLERLVAELGDPDVDGEDGDAE